ncbi:unnamed protein product, partial [Nesidiocoris tenuis]
VDQKKRGGVWRGSRSNYDIWTERWRRRCHSHPQGPCLRLEDSDIFKFTGCLVASAIDSRCTLYLGVIRRTTLGIGKMLVRPLYRTQLVAQTGSLLTPFLDMTFNFYAPSILNFRRSTSNPNEVSRKVREFYFRDNNRLNNYVPIEQAATDSLFAYPVHKEIENHQGPVYSYVFDYKGTPSLYGLLNLANRRTEILRRQ